MNNSCRTSSQSHHRVTYLDAEDLNLGDGLAFVGLVAGDLMAENPGKGGMIGEHLGLYSS
jgi:hypothetical protein